MYRNCGLVFIVLRLLTSRFIQVHLSGPQVNVLGVFGAVGYYEALKITLLITKLRTTHLKFRLCFTSIPVLKKINILSDTSKLISYLYDNFSFKDGYWRLERHFLLNMVGKNLILQNTYYK